MKINRLHKDIYIAIVLAISITLASGFIGLFLHVQYNNKPLLETDKSYTWEELLTEPVFHADKDEESKPARQSQPREKSKREQHEEFPTLSPIMGGINKKEIPGKNLDLKRIEKRKKYIRNNFTDFISASKSSYLSREPIGVYDIFISVQNNAEFVLDLVTLDVQYLSRERGILQTNQFLVENIKPFQKKTIEAYDNDNASDVNIIISSIVSTEMNFCFSAEKLNSEKPDPFFCDTLQVSLYRK